jgi:hypothetical protein
LSETLKIAGQLCRRSLRHWNKKGDVKKRAAVFYVVQVGFLAAAAAPVVSLGSSSSTDSQSYKSSRWQWSSF